MVSNSAWLSVSGFSSVKRGQQVPSACSLVVRTCGGKEASYIMIAIVIT